MEVRWYDGSTPKIADLRGNVEDGKVILSFKWPNELEQVYIYKRSLLDDESIDWERPYKKYTKDEYASFNGYIDRKLSGVICEYIICPYVREGEENFLIRFKDECNRIKLMTQRIEIRYQLKEKKKLFSNKKLVQINVFCEREVPKEYLAYVKKKNGIPSQLDDGMRFDFVSDFHAGDNSFPEIEVDKEEQVRIYLTDEIPFKEAYRVIKL